MQLDCPLRGFSVYGQSGRRAAMAVSWPQPRQAPQSQWPGGGKLALAFLCVRSETTLRPACSAHGESLCWEYALARDPFNERSPLAAVFGPDDPGPTIWAEGLSTVMTGRPIQLRIRHEYHP